MFLEEIKSYLNKKNIIIAIILLLSILVIVFLINILLFKGTVYNGKDIQYIKYGNVLYSNNLTDIGAYEKINKKYVLKETYRGNPKESITIKTIKSHTSERSKIRLQSVLNSFRGSYGIIGEDKATALKTLSKCDTVYITGYITDKTLVKTGSQISLSIVNETGDILLESFLDSNNKVEGVAINLRSDKEFDKVKDIFNFKKVFKVNDLTIDAIAKSKILKFNEKTGEAILFFKDGTISVITNIDHSQMRIEVRKYGSIGTQFVSKFYSDKEQK